MKKPVDTLQRFQTDFPDSFCRIDKSQNNQFRIRPLYQETVVYNNRCLFQKKTVFISTVLTDRNFLNLLPGRRV